MCYGKTSTQKIERQIDRQIHRSIDTYTHLDRQDDPHRVLYVYFLATQIHQKHNLSFFPSIFINFPGFYLTIYLLEAKHSCDPVCRSVGQSVCRSVCLSLKDGKFHFYAPIGALVNLFIYLSICINFYRIFQLNHVCTYINQSNGICAPTLVRKITYISV